MIAVIRRTGVAALSVSALLATALLASEARAQYAPSQGVEISPFGGYYIGSDIFTAGGSVPLENSFMWGGRVTLSPNRRAGVEFSYTRATSEIGAPRGLANPYPRSKVGDLTYDSYDINFLGYQPTASDNVRPFALIGFGWTVASPDIPNRATSSSTLFNINFGLGVKAYVHEKFGVRLEGRWRTTETGIETDSYYWCDFYGNCFSYGTSWYNSWELSGGLIIPLGGR